jgi:hypothetical protein
MVGCKLRPTVVGRGLAFLPGATPNRNFWVWYGRAQAGKIEVEVEGIDDASVIIRQLSVDITAETVLKPIVTNCLNLVHTK